jgi:hypothetical protein
MLGLSIYQSHRERFLELFHLELLQRRLVKVRVRVRVRARARARARVGVS